VPLLVSRNERLDPVMTSRSVVSAKVAGLIVRPPDGDEVTLWVLRIFDGDPLDKDTKRLYEYYREVHPPQSAEACFADAETTLRSFYRLGGLVKDPSPLVGFKRSWTRKTPLDPRVA
jgi:hypothetical protein